VATWINGHVNIPKRLPYSPSKVIAHLMQTKELGLPQNVLVFLIVYESKYINNLKLDLKKTLSVKLNLYEKNKL